MDSKYSEFLFQTLYMLVNKSKEEYDLLFGEIEKAYKKYQKSDILKNNNISEYDAIEKFLIKEKGMVCK
jgi:hypothetical protein